MTQSLTSLLQKDPAQLDYMPAAQNGANNGLDSKGVGFDQYLSAKRADEAKQKHTGKQQVKEHTAVARKSRVAEDKPAETVKQMESISAKTENAQQENTQTETENVKAAVTTGETDVAKAQNEVLQTVADTLQIPVETLIMWLAELNIQPEELVEPKAVSEMLQKYFDLPSPALLLTEPDFQPMFEAVNEALADFKPIFETAEYIPKYQAPEGLRMVTDEGNRPIVFSVNTAEQVVEDEGELLLSESDDEMFAANAGTTQREAVQTVTPRDQTTDNQTTGQDAALFTNQPDVELRSDQIINTQFENIVTNTTVEAAAQPVTTGANATVDAADVMNQIMSQVRMRSGDQFAELRITLRPENLGDVTLRVITQNGIVSAQFVAESQRIKEVLESNFNQLRDTLQQQGVQISDLTVSVRQENSEGQMNEFLRAQQSGRRRFQRIQNANASEAEELTQPVDASEIMLSNVDLRA